AEGREQLFRLIEGADIFVQNLRPGVTEKLGLGPKAMLERNPRLVYCDMGAFGHLGPKRHHPGFEILFQAYSGLMANTGEPDRDPVRMGAQICDFGTGLWTAFGALAALRQRDRTGKGVVVNTSLLETALYFMSTHFRSEAAPPGFRDPLPGLFRTDGEHRRTGPRPGAHGGADLRLRHRPLDCVRCARGTSPARPHGQGGSSQHVAARDGALFHEHAF